MRSTSLCGTSERARDLHRATLSNGLRVLLAPDPSTPVVGVAVHVDVGFRSEPEGRTGFAHLFEHLMFQGSESLEKLAHFRHVQGSGGVFNGSTHQDYTDYFEVLPAAALERALFLEADRLRAPTLTAENLRNQVDVVKEEIRLNVLNRPYGGFPWILLPPVLYDTFPNAHNGYGDFTELEQASLDDAAAFFDTYYAPGNAQVTVAGYLGSSTSTGCSRWSRSTSATSRPAPPRRGRRSPSRRPGSERRAVSPDAHAPLPALAVGYRLPDPGADLDAYLGARAARLDARRRRGGPPAAPARARRRSGHRRLGRRGPDGPAGRARPRHVHDHRRAPTDGGPGPGARRRSTRSWTSSPPPGPVRTSWPGRSRAGPRRCTTKTTG